MDVRKGPRTGVLGPRWYGSPDSWKGGLDPTSSTPTLSTLDLSVPPGVPRVEDHSREGPLRYGLEPLCVPVSVPTPRVAPTLRRYNSTKLSLEKR